MMTSKTYPHELIGTGVIVLKSTNKNDEGKDGKVIDETKMTLTLDVQGKKKILFKNNITLQLKRTGAIIEGKNLSKRPEERIKC